MYRKTCLLKSQLHGISGLFVARYFSIFHRLHHRLYSSLAKEARSNGVSHGLLKIAERHLSRCIRGDSRRRSPSIVVRR
jgi:hypothetical protein